VYVQPIPPVLDVTRKLVIRYNELYREAIRGVKGKLILLLVHIILAFKVNGRAY
jgi:hypothetical protein